MAEFVCDCPRCGASEVTFDVRGDTVVGLEYDWARVFEAFCVCRRCKKGTIFYLLQKDYDFFSNKKVSIQQIDNSINRHFDCRGYVNLLDRKSVDPPDHVPENISSFFSEATRCMSAKCWNASGAMFRLCIDAATSGFLPEDETPGLNSKTRRDLGLRLPWLFDNGILPDDLRELSACIREDGNDAAHRGTLTQQDAEDLLDFAVALLERLFTVPERVRLAGVRRGARRAVE